MVLPFLALAAAGATASEKLFPLFSKGAKKLKKKQYELQKAQARANLEDVRSSVSAAEEDNPYQLNLQKQSMFGRGLGKSSIHEQARTRLTNAQARQMAALRRQEDLAYKGLSLIKYQRKYERRMLPLQILGTIGESLGYANSMGAFGGKA